MKIRIGLSNGWKLDFDVADDAPNRCHALPNVRGEPADRFAFWRQETGDNRISGHAMVWEVYDEPRKSA